MADKIKKDEIYRTRSAHGRNGKVLVEKHLRDLIVGGRLTLMLVANKGYGVVDCIHVSEQGPVTGSCE